MRKLRNSNVWALVAGFFTVVVLTGLLVISQHTDFLAVHAEPMSGSPTEIDKFILQALKDSKIEPSPLCTDAEFLRRVYLDVAGVIPTRAEARQFLMDRSADKRSKLIDTLLKSDRYPEHWAVMWCDLLREHTGSKPQEGTERGSYRKWIKQSLASNMPYDQFARELITATGDPEENPAVNFYLRDEMDRVETANEVSTVFMGTRMACAQCHDHPFDKWTQTDFHGLMAFFGRTNVAGDPPLTLLKVEKDPILPADSRKLLEPYFKEAHEAVEKAKLKAPGDEGGAGMGMGMGMMMMNGKKAVNMLKEIDENNTLTQADKQRTKQVFQRNQVRQVLERNQGDYHMPADGTAVKRPSKDGEVIEPVFAWDKTEKFTASGSRRKALADFVTGSRRFASVQVNRLWDRLMGRGIVDPIDDFREKNPPSHPELLEYLTDEFIKAKFDNKAVLKLILNSNTYQRSSTANATNKSDKTMFSHYRVHRMTAEQMYDSILVSTGLEKGMSSSMGDMKGEGPKKYMRGEAMMNQKIQWAEDFPTPAQTGTFLNEFNQPTREQITIKRDDAGSISQALEMMNGDRLNSFVNSSPLLHGLIQQRASADQIVTDLYLAVLSRPPTSAELSFSEGRLRSGADLPALQDLHWALLNTREFAFIH